MWGWKSEQTLAAEKFNKEIATVLAGREYFWTQRQAQLRFLDSLKVEARMSMKQIETEAEMKHEEDKPYKVGMPAMVYLNDSPCDAKIQAVYSRQIKGKKEYFYEVIEPHLDDGQEYVITHADIYILEQT